MSELIEIRCPNMTKKKKKGVEVEEVCNRLSVRVNPGSSGKAYCVKCDKDYAFEVAKDNSSIYDILSSSEKRA